MCFLILSTRKNLCEIVQAEMLGNIIQPSQSQCGEGLYRGLIDDIQTSPKFSGGINKNLLLIWTIYLADQSFSTSRTSTQIRKEISEHTCFSLIFLSLANFFSSGVSLNALSFLVCSSDPMFCAGTWTRPCFVPRPSSVTFLTFFTLPTFLT